MKWWLVIISMCILLTLLLILSTTKEWYVNYDPNQVEENCLNFIQTKGWELDYGLPPAKDPNEKNKEFRQKMLRLRADIISNLTAVKSSMYSIWGQQYRYSDACLLQKKIKDQYQLVNGNCTIEGKVLGPNKINKYGRREVKGTTIQLHTPESFARVATLNQKEMTPNNGCFIDARNKDSFFYLIDQLAAQKNFQTENRVNLYENVKNKQQQIANKEREQKVIAQRNYQVEKKQKEVVQRDLKVAQRDLKNIKSYLNKTFLVEKCRLVNTPWYDDGRGNFKNLSHHNVKCNDNEVLQQVQLQKHGNKMSYAMKCCNINTNIGDNARFDVDSENETDDIKAAKLMGRWFSQSLYKPNVQTMPACKQKIMNGFEMQTKEVPASFKYVTTCSDIQNDLLNVKPHKKIYKTYAQGQTPFQKFDKGSTHNMTRWNIICPPKSYISNMAIVVKDIFKKKKRSFKSKLKGVIRKVLRKKNKGGGKPPVLHREYAVKYQCVRPYMT